MPGPHELRLVATREQVRSVIAQYLQRRRPLLLSFVQQLRTLRATLEASETFQTHAFIRSSILFVYSAETNHTQLRLIDLPKTSPVGTGDDGRPLRIDHRLPWVEDNHEDGYLTGLDNMIDIFEELLAAESPAL